MFATPILDLEHPLPQPSQAWIPRVIGLVIGLVISLIIIMADQNRLPLWHWPGINGLLLIPALYVGLALHETGHLSLGTLVGLETGGISVGASCSQDPGEIGFFSLIGEDLSGDSSSR